MTARGWLRYTPATMKILVTLPDGTQREAVGTPGQSVMQFMRNAGIPVTAACGGALACATCHVDVAPEWRAKVGPAGDEESDLLDMSDYRSEGSRLSCQIEATDALDGLQIMLQLDAVEG
jgi:2Fe-2S ferredoxin